jgi:methylated-DNA-[protein]-cysteine S-methyltransferase
MLPESSPDRMQKELTMLTGSASQAEKIPAWIRALTKQVVWHLQGKLQDFSAIPTVTPNATPFMHKVYAEARRIPAGEVISYAQLAARMGHAAAVRAVGTALGKNPVPLIIPCHRIIATSGKLGGFSAHGGIDAKKQLLRCEGVSIEKPRLIATSAQWRAGEQHLRRDKVMAALMKKVGTVPFRPLHNAEPLEAFTNAIVSQQLSVKAAATIYARVEKLAKHRGEFSAKKILATSDETWRAAGLSQMKVTYLKDLAQHCVDKKLPTLNVVRTMSDEQLVRCFSTIKGIGRWSVEMYLIFDLGRADVFPVDDYGIRKAIAQLYDLPSLPAPKHMEQYAEAWRPYRSIASLYLWRLLDNA